VKEVTESKAGQDGSANSIPRTTHTTMKALSQSGPARTVKFNLPCHSAKFASNEAQTCLSTTKRSNAADLKSDDASKMCMRRKRGGDSEYLLSENKPIKDPEDKNRIGSEVAVIQAR